MPALNALIVDDDPSMIELLSLYAKRSMVKHVLAIDGLDALNKVRNEPFDLIITDLRMPRMDGVKFIQNVRALPSYKNVPIFVVTASYEKLKFEMTSLDKVYIVPKPVDRAAIEHMLQGGVTTPSLPVKTFFQMLKDEWQSKLEDIFLILFKEPIKGTWIKLTQEGASASAFSSVNFCSSIVAFPGREKKEEGPLIHVLINFDPTAIGTLEATTKQMSDRELGSFVIKLSNTLINKVQQGLGQTDSNAALRLLGCFRSTTPDHGMWIPWSKPAEDLFRLESAKGKIEILFFPFTAIK